MLKIIQQMLKTFFVFFCFELSYNLGFEIHKPSREISKELFFKGLRGIALRTPAKLAYTT